MRSAILPGLIQKIMATASSDDAIQRLPLPSWRSNSVVFHIESGYIQAMGISDISLVQGNLAQAKITKLLVEAEPDILQDTICRRLAAIDINLGDDLVSRGLGSIKLIRNLPACVHMSWMKIVTNAWNTDKRYGREVSHCHWCNMYRGDDLKHYLSCPMMLKFLHSRSARLFSSWASWPSPPLLPALLPLAFGMGNNDIVQPALIWLDFLTFAYAEAKHTSRFKFSIAWSARVRVIKRMSSDASRVIDACFD